MTRNLIKQIPSENVLDVRSKFPVFGAITAEIISNNLIRELESSGEDFVRRKYGKNLNKSINPKVAVASVGIPEKYLFEYEKNPEKFGENFESVGRIYGLNHIARTHHPGNIYGVNHMVSTHHPGNEWLLVKIGSGLLQDPSLRERGQQHYLEMCEIYNNRAFDLNLEKLVENPKIRKQFLEDSKKLGRAYSFITDNLYVPFQKDPNYTIQVIDKDKKELPRKFVDTVAYNTLRNFFQQKQEEILREQ